MDDLLKTETISIAPAMLRTIAAIDEFKGAWTALGRLAPERLDKLRRVAAIESIGSSTRIEGAKLSDCEVDQLLSKIDVTSFANRDEQEVAGYAAEMETIFAHYDAIDLTENHVKRLHRDEPQYDQGPPQGPDRRRSYRPSRCWARDLVCAGMSPAGAAADQAGTRREGTDTPAFYHYWQTFDHAKVIDMIRILSLASLMIWKAR